MGVLMKVTLVIGSREVGGAERAMSILANYFAKKWLVAMGRLTYVKGYDLLLTAFQKIAMKFDDWKLIILGEGSLRPELENLRRTLNLEYRVILPGLLKNPSHQLSINHPCLVKRREYYAGFLQVCCRVL